MDTAKRHSFEIDQDNDNNCIKNHQDILAMVKNLRSFVRKVRLFTLSSTEDRIVSLTLFISGE